MNLANRFISGIGSLHTNAPHAIGKPYYRKDYIQLAIVDIERMLKLPQSVAKEHAQWAIFSNLQTRNHEQQLINGSFGMLWADLDKLHDSFTIEVVTTLLSDITTAKAYVYHTSSSTTLAPCYRILIPLNEPLSGVDFKASQRVLNDKLEMRGLTPDRSTERTGQVCYLPNIMPNKPDVDYSYRIIDGQCFNVLTVFSEELAVVKSEQVEQAAEQQEATRQAMVKCAERCANGTTSPMDAYNALMPLDVLLLNYGYVKSGKQYRSPNQQSKSAAVTIKGNKWVSLSESDSECGIGKASSTGCYGDAFDLYAFYECDNCSAKALKRLGDSLRDVNGVSITKANQRKHMQSLQVDRVAQVFKDVVAPNLQIEKSVIKLADVDSRPMQMVNDQMFDALTCRDSLFNSRLADFSGCYHWWNGKAWEMSEDSLLRRHIGNAMLSGEIKTTKTRIDGTLSVMKDQLPLMGDINPPNRVVIFNNGVLNLDSFKLDPHDVKFKNSRYIDVDYSEEFKAPIWDNWLNEIFESDLERRELLQEMLGFCLTRSNLGIEKALLFVGATRSGKGTIAKILKRILDCGASSFNLDQINDNKILSSMIGRNVAIDYECANPQKREAKAVAATFKSITSNDSVTIPLLYTQKPWSGALGCKLLALANSVPRLFDDSGATASRWIPLVFDKSFLGKEDPTLEARLAGELDAIVNWSVIGLKRLVANGKFTSATSSINEMESMKQQGSPINQFITDCLIVGETEKTFDKNIKASYRHWCMANDEYQLKGADLFTALQDALRSQGVTRKSSVRMDPNTSPLRGFTGISVKPIVYAHPIPFEKHYNQVKGGY